MDHNELDEKTRQAIINHFKERVKDSFHEIKDKEQANAKKWQEEKPLYESRLDALQQSTDILKQAVKQAQQKVATHTKNFLNSFLNLNDQKQRDAYATLQQQLDDVKSKLSGVEDQLANVTDSLNKPCHGRDERDLLSTKLVVLQDTKLLLKNEAEYLQGGMQKIEKELEVQAEKRRAEESGLSELHRLEAELQRAKFKIGRLKQSLYFPATQGYRFSTGSARVFAAAKDLHIPELSGRFMLDIERQERYKEKVVVLTISAHGGITSDIEETRGTGSGPAARSANRASTQKRRPSASGATSQGPTPETASSSPHSSMDAGGSPGHPPQGLSNFARSRPGTGTQGHQDNGGGATEGARTQKTSLEGQSSRIAQQPPARDRGRQPPIPPSIPPAPRGSAPGAVLPERNGPVNLPYSTRSSGEIIPPLSRSEGGTEQLAAGFLSSLTKNKKRMENILQSGGREEGELREGTNLSRSRFSNFSKLARAITNKVPIIREVKGTVKMIRKGMKMHKSSSAMLDDESGYEETGDVSTSTHISDELFTTSFDGNAIIHVNAEEALPDVDLPTGFESSDDDSGSGRTCARNSQSSYYSQEPEGVSGKRANEDITLNLSQQLPPQSSSPDGVDEDLAILQEFERQEARMHEGVYLTLMADGVSLIGERGSRLPNMTIRELVLEIEVVFRAVMEYTPALGWKAPSKVKFSVVQLKHLMTGNSLPLPQAVLKAVINAYVPGMLTRILLGQLPDELGQYVLDSGQSVHMSAEIKLNGPPLATYAADLTLSKWVNDVARDGGRARHAAAAAIRARRLLGLDEATSKVLADLMTGKHALLSGVDTAPSILTLRELVKFYERYSRYPEIWSHICSVYNQAAQALLYRANPSVRPSFDFGHFMNEAVASVSRKPVRVMALVDRLEAGLDVDALLSSARNVLEKYAREFHKRCVASDPDYMIQGSAPLDEQLDNLALWYKSTSVLLSRFKSRFHSASFTLMASADRDVFQAGADDVVYDGPLKLKIPLTVPMDADNSFVWDLKLPRRQEQQAHMMNMVQEVVFNMADHLAAATGKDGAPAVPSTPPNGNSSPSISDGMAGSSTSMSNRMVAFLGANGWGGMSPSTSGAPDTPGPQSGNSCSSDLLDLLMSKSVVGQLVVRKIAFSLKLDEERVRELMAGGGRDAAELMGTLMGCFGDLLRTSLDVGWVPDTSATPANSSGGNAEPAPLRPRCTLQVENSDLTRVRAEIDSLMVQSMVSPKLAVKLLYAILAGLTTQFRYYDGYQMRFLDKVFSHVYEYVSKDTLDISLCVSARAGITPDKQLVIKLGGSPGTGSDGGLEAANGASSGGAAGAPCPVYFINDINLHTVLDSFNLMSTPL